MPEVKTEAIHADDSAESVVAAIGKLDRATAWTIVDRIPLQFEAHHPQGITRVGDRLFLSTVELIEPTVRYPEPRDGLDRSPGMGKGHLIEMDLSGKLLRRLALGRGAIYHPGGIDFDGASLWVPVSEYRPSSQSIIYRIEPESLQAAEAFRLAEHVGGIVRDQQTGLLHAVTWGARRLLTLDTKGTVLHNVEHRSHVIDHQGCVCAGGGRVVCTGVSEYRTPAGELFQLGGIAAVNVHNGFIEYEVPISVTSASGRAVTYNAVHLEVARNRLQMLAVPDDGAAPGDSQLLILQAKF